VTPLGVVLEVFVPGHPKTKGSLEKQGGRMVESVVGSKKWRQMMAYTATVGRGNRVESESGPVAVRLVFWLPVADVAAGRPGDIDKLARNALDALTDAKAYADDAQVIRLIAEKYPVHAGRPQGVLIQVWRVPPVAEFVERVQVDVARLESGDWRVIG
jgi:Holliday junction resolvase RusA-like endonuclease